MSQRGITSWFVKMYNGSNGFIEIKFPHNGAEMIFRLKPENILQDIADLNITKYELTQLLNDMDSEQAYDKTVETRFFKRIRFTLGDTYSNGSLIFYWENGDLSTNVRVENTRYLQNDISDLIHTFNAALGHCKKISGLQW